MTLIRTQALPSVQALRENKVKTFTMDKAIKLNLNRGKKVSVTTDRTDGIPSGGHGFG